MSDEQVELENFEPQEAEHLISRRVCARCWGELEIIEFPDERLVQVVCPTCGESVEITGHISKNTPSIIMENAKFSYREVAWNLKDIFPKSKNKVRSQEEIIKELGF